jgi:hypothetical protein
MFYKLSRANAPGAQPSAAMALVAAAAAAAARCNGCVAVSVGSMLLTPQPLSSTEMLSLLCCEIELQLSAKLGSHRNGFEGRPLHILQNAAASSSQIPYSTVEILPRAS